MPTPVNHEISDLSMLIEASKTVGKFLSEGDLVVFESTVYPGVTEEKCAPVIENYSGLKCQWEDNGVSGFFLGYSPERINPGDKIHRLKDVVKVTSGSTPKSAEHINQVYAKIIDAGTHKASSKEWLRLRK